MNPGSEIVQLRKDHHDAPQPSPTPRVTLVVPVYNEEASIAIFMDRITQVITDIGP